MQDRTDDLAPALRSFGIVNDAAILDLEQDGDMDVVVVGEWTGVGILHNDGGRLELMQSDLLDHKGWWQSLTQTDANQDGLTDLVLGNVGLNTKHSASQQKPFRIYAEDFDASGSLDIVLAKSYQDEYVPVRGRECSSQQMPFIAQDFDTYNEFANASLQDIFGDDLTAAYQGWAETFASYLLVNNGAGFDLMPLPQAAQVFPILGGVASDLDGDGDEDLVLAGCIYNTEVETPRQDAGSGLVLLNDGKGSYRTGQCPAWCIDVTGNIKDLLQIELVDGRSIMAMSRNDDALFLYQLPHAPRRTQ